MRRVGDELALRMPRLLARREHRVEARRAPAQLIPSAPLDAMSEVLRAGDTRGGAGQPPNRHERCPRDEQAQRGGEADAAQADGSEDELESSERAVDVGQ